MDVLCYIEIGRSRVNSCYSRDIGCLYISAIRATDFKNERKWKWGPGGKIFGPSVSIKDRSVVGSVDRGLNCTNRMPGVGGSRNR